MIKTQYFNEEYHDVLINSSSGPIQNEVSTVTSEHKISEHDYERKLETRISPYSQSFENQEEQLIEFKGEQQMEKKYFSPEHIENKRVTLTSETLSSEDSFETKLQAKFDRSDKKMNNQKNNFWVS